MKRSLIAIPLMLLSTMALANGKLSCGAEREINDDPISYTETKCVYHGTSFKDAASALLEERFVKFHSYESVGTTPQDNSKKVDDAVWEQRLTWANPNEVNISGCEEGTDSCINATFKRSGNKINITQTFQ